MLGHAPFILTFSPFLTGQVVFVAFGEEAERLGRTQRRAPQSLSLRPLADTLYEGGKGSRHLLESIARRLLVSLALPGYPLVAVRIQPRQGYPPLLLSALRVACSDACSDARRHVSCHSGQALRGGEVWNR